MKISKFFQILSAIAGIFLWYGIYPVCVQDEAVSAKLFTEGKTWSRIMQVFPDVSPIAEPVNVTVDFTVVKGHKPLLPPPDEIVIEIVNPSRWVVPNNIRRIVLSPENGNFRGYYIREFGNPTWYKATEGWDKERYKKRLHIYNDSTAQFSYPFLPLPIPWKDSAFQLDNEYTGPPVEVTTKIENNTLKVVAEISTYGFMKSDGRVKINEDKIIAAGEIHMIFKKGEPWAASVWSESEDLNAFPAFLKLRSPEDK